MHETLSRSSKGREKGWKRWVCARQIPHCFCLMSCKVHLSEWKQIIYYCKKRPWQQTTLLVTDRGVQSAVRSLTRIKYFPLVSNSISPPITNMGGSWGQRWFRLPCYQHHGDRSVADACAEYKHSPDLMSVAHFQKMCPPLYLWTEKVIWLGKRCSILQPQVNLCLESGPLQIKLFDLALLALLSAPVLWWSPWAALAYWLRQMYRPHQPM